MAKLQLFQQTAISGLPSCRKVVISLPMPKIFEQDGYRFFFYSNEHRPIHVHVRRGNGEAVFIMEEEIQLRESQGMKLKELTRAEELALEHKELIMKAWHEYLG